MKTLHRGEAPRAPVSAGRHPADEDLAVLTRANHDMRSPLSVLLGVLELLEDSPGLNDGERRYLKFGRDAASDLLGQADALRLYSALRRELVAPDAGSADLHGLAREQLTRALAGRDVTLDCSDGEHPAAACDAGYLGVALAALCKHVTAHLPAPESGDDLVLRVDTILDRHGAAVLQIHGLDHPEGHPADVVHATTPRPGEQSVAVVNAVQLVELMGGSVAMDVELAYLRVALPSTAPEPTDLR